MDVEQVHHALVLGARHPLQRGDDGCLFRPPQHIPQRQAAGHGVRIRVVVQHDDDAVGIAEESLVLLDLEAGERPAELGEKRASEQLGEGEVIQFGKLRLQLLFALAEVGSANAEHVNQRPSRIPDRLQNLLEAPLPRILDDDAGSGGQVGFEVGVGAAEVAGRDAQAAVVEAPGDRFGFNQELDLEARQQDLVQHPGRQLGLADGETPHLRLGTPTKA
jgi:hypothetical protein